MQTNHTLSATDRTAVLKLLRQTRPDLQALYLFGSAATGELGPQSDIDLALLFSPAQSKTLPLYGSEAHSALSRYVGRDIDLINLRQVATVFQVQIISTGQLLFDGDRYARQTFEMYAYSFYQKLNEERAEILAQLYATGEAYRV